MLSGKIDAWSGPKSGVNLILGEIDEHERIDNVKEEDSDISINIPTRIVV